MSVRFGISIPACERIDRVADAARRAERLGFDAVWMPDAPVIWRDCLMALAFAAAQTSRVTIGTGVTGTAIRHPAVVASAMRTLDELAPGRARLGLGSGGGMGWLLGLPAASRARIREDVEAVRTLLAGRWLDVGERHAKLMGPTARVPVHLAAGGSRMAELAGEIADGVIFSVGGSPEAVRASIERLAPGLERAGRSREQIEVACIVWFAHTEDPERDIARFKPVCCLLAGEGTGSAILEDCGIDPARVKALAQPYPGIAHAQDWDEAARIAGTVISDEAALRMARHFGLFGGLETIAQGIDALRETGVDQILIRPIEAFRVPHDEIEAFAAAALPPPAGA